MLCICVLREQLFCFWESAIFRNLSITESNAAGCFGEMQEAIAIPKLNPASPPAEQSSAFNLHGERSAACGHSVSYGAE